MSLARRRPSLPARAERLCDRLRAGEASPARTMETLRGLGAAAVPALAALLRERGAGYAYAVRLLAAAATEEARATLREAAGDAGARECDRFEAAVALDDQGDPAGRPVLRSLAARGTLRAAAFLVLSVREGGIEDRDLVLGPWLDDDEVRPLAVEEIRRRGAETGGSLDSPPERERFRTGWRAGVFPAPPLPAAARRGRRGKRRA